jgi:hypothetical protein
MYKKLGYGNFNLRYVSPIHLHALLNVVNFTKVFRSCVDRLRSGLQVWETLAYTT